jgi:hypothetical protein
LAITIKFCTHDLNGTCVISASCCVSRWHDQLASVRLKRKLGGYAIPACCEMVYVCVRRAYVSKQRRPNISATKAEFCHRSPACVIASTFDQSIASSVFDSSSAASNLLSLLL